MINSWSFSRLNKYEECPRKAKYEIVDKLCPRCFKGKVMGGFETPAICDTCGEEIVKGEALVRGDDIGKRLDLFLTGEAKTMPAEIRNPQAQSIVKEARQLVAKSKGHVQLDIIVDRNWKVMKKTGVYAPRGYWAWFKLDFYSLNGGKVGLVTDWKTGGIDKQTGAVREDGKYDDQLKCYTVAALCAFPQLDAANARLVFLDTGPRYDPVVVRKAADLDRKDLPKAQKFWEGKVKAMLSDRVFAPRPNEKCKFCDFSQRKGGPCPN